MTHTEHNKPTIYLRLPQIIGNKRDIPPLLPVSRTHFLDGVKSGKYPKPVKLGARMVAWRQSDIHDLLESLGGEK